MPDVTGTPTSMPAEEVSKAIATLDEHGKKLSLRDIWRILVTLPMKMWLAAFTAAAGIASGAFFLGKWVESLPPTKDTAGLEVRPAIEPVATPLHPQPNPCLRKGTAIFIDGYGKYAGYRSVDRKQDRSNAHFLVEQIRDDRVLSQSVDARNAIVAQTGRIDVSQIIAMQPDLVVIHRSTFEPVDGDPEQRLLELITSLKGTPAIFLVFSRTRGTDGRYAAELARQAGTEGRVFAYQFRDGNPFAERATVIEFLRYVKMLTRAQVAHNCEATAKMVLVRKET